MKLDVYDKKLLLELDIDASLSVSALAKKIQRSKQFVVYRLQKLEKEVITGYHAIVDMSKLGYFTFRVYFNFQQMSKEQEQLFVQTVQEKFPEVWTITTMHGKWDYALFLGVKNIVEFHTLWDSLLVHYKKHIKKYTIALYAPIHNFNRAFFLTPHKKNTHTVERVYGVGCEEIVDDIDLSLLKLYASNVRLSSLHIAKQLGISSDTVRRRIKNLEKRKIIVGYKLGLHLEHLDLTSYRVDLHLLSTEKNKDLFWFCKQHPYIYQVNKTIGGADFELELVAKDFTHLSEILNDLKTTFIDVVNDVDYFGFSTFHVLKYIPD